jgi:DNA-binding IclR family transcriptional regulator
METKLIKILQCLDRASSGCPLGYITRHTNIPEPLSLLEVLEENDLVQRCSCDGWSPIGHPRFEISAKGSQKLRDIEASSIQIPIRVLEKAFVGH